MRRRPTVKFHPALEQFEAKQLMSAGTLAGQTSTATMHTQSVAANSDKSPAALPHRFLGFRVTNTPFKTQYKLQPPFLQVLAQGTQPVPGQTYNVLQIAVMNGTAQTFTASNNFSVSLTGNPQVFPDSHGQ